VQRLIVAQIDSNPDAYSGLVDTNHAPWFDWGPYLWTDGDTGRSDGVVWCNGQHETQCNNGIQRDVRYGDTMDQLDYWGDFTHPAWGGEQKVANLLVTFFTKTIQNGGSAFVQGWNQQ